MRSEEEPLGCVRVKATLAPVALALSIIVAAALFAHAYRTRSRANNELLVVGSGSRNFEADLIVWSGSFTRRAMELRAASAALQEDRESVKAFLLRKGAKPEDVVFSSIQVSKDFDETVQKDGTRTSTFAGYRLEQKVTIESKEVAKYERIAREITELLNAGVEFTSNEPAYFYTKLASLKIQMVADATRDARRRAEQIAEHAGGTLGKLKAATLGVFQITAQNSSEEFSWRGNYNTDSRRKTATVTARLRYEVE